MFNNFTKHCKFKPMLCECVVFYMSWGKDTYIYFNLYTHWIKYILNSKLFLKLRFNCKT